MDLELAEIRSRLLVLEKGQAQQPDRAVLDAIYSEIKILRRDMAHLRVDFEYTTQLDNGHSLSTKLDSVLEKLCALAATGARGDQETENKSEDAQGKSLTFEHALFDTILIDANGQPSSSN